MRARYAAPDERLVLLVGRLVYEKGFHLALDALPGVIERVGGVRFLVAGSGTAERDLKAQAEKLGLLSHGEFLGWIDDAMLHSLYAMSDLCVIPSLYEPFGLVALEAMASGCPCIVADTGGLREVVPGGERVGLRFTPRDSESLAERMETAADRRRAARHGSWPRRRSTSSASTGPTSPAAPPRSTRSSSAPASPPPSPRRSRGALRPASAAFTRASARFTLAVARRNAAGRFAFDSCR